MVTDEYGAASTAIHPMSPALRIRPSAMASHPLSVERGNVNSNRTRCQRSAAWCFETSFVIGRDRGAGGGALARLRTLASLGLGGTVGSGTQGMSWIHETDLNRLFERALTNERMRGAYIASSPNPVSQREFM